MKIAFQGELGSNGHELCVEAFAGDEAVACETFAAAFAAVRSGACDLGLMAMENSSAGRVAEVHALLPTSGLTIVGERFKRVRLFLLAAADESLETIRLVRSHPMALAQCSLLIDRLGLRAEAVADTAGAARLLSHRPEAGVAAIATAIAGDLYGLTPLCAAEDDARNTTRFIVVRRLERLTEPPPGVACLTSLLFTLQDIPAALPRALGSFASNGVEVVKLESYMPGEGRFRARRFYCEVEGRTSSSPLKEALAELVLYTSEHSVVGVYEADPARRVNGGCSGTGRRRLSKA